MPVPVMPVITAVVAADSEITVQWIYSGDSSITSYTVYLAANGTTTTTVISDRTILFKKITGLTNGTTYTVSMIASNSTGGSTPSTTTTITPFTIPTAPTITSVTAGDGQARVQWSAPSSDGGSPIINYIVQSTPGNLYIITPSGTSVSANVRGLRNGVSYTMTVTAVNAAGISPTSAASGSVTPVTVPLQPIILSAVGGTGQATVSWLPPIYNGDSAITGYTIQSNPGNITVSAGPTDTSGTVTGLSIGQTYTFTVTATNPVGNSVPSPPSTPITMPGIPNPPEALAIKAGDTFASLTWNPPSVPNGGPVTGYNVTAVNLTSSADTPPSIMAYSTSFVFPGLINGNTYQFSVKTVNGSGQSAPSGTVNIVPVGIPSPPIIRTVVAGSKSITLTWSIPASDGGSAVTSYNIVSVYTINPVTIRTIDPDLTRISYTMRGLTPGVAYVFYVTAKNAVGTSINSASSAPVVPLA